MIHEEGLVGTAIIAFDSEHAFICPLFWDGKVLAIKLGTNFHLLFLHIHVLFRGIGDPTKYSAPRNQPTPANDPGPRQEASRDVKRARRTTNRVLREISTAKRQKD